MVHDDAVTTGHDDAASAETHISWLLLRGDRAFKVLKPVRTDVLDFGDVEHRRTACEQEVALNARLAPDVYLGVGSLTLGGDELEPVVVMRRMPASRRLAALLDDPDAAEHVRSVARAVAVFHAGARVLDEDEAVSVASAAALTHRWADDLAGLRDIGGTDLRDWVERIEAMVLPYLEGRAELFEDRIEWGMVRDGHGDLLAEDIFCLDDGPRILDCLAFSDSLRCGDVLADVAFLVMDLQRLGHPELARRFLHDYCEFSGEHHPGSLAHLYVAQRALVRAKVTALRERQVDGGREAVIGLLELVVDHLQRAQLRTVLVGGLPGSGKSTFAQRMADEFGWTVISSDEVRRDLGLRYADLGGDDAYDPATVARVYEAMRRRGAHLLRHGMSVVLDATWTSAEQRARTREIVGAAGAAILEVRCEAPPEVCQQRIRARGPGSPSEATPDVVDVLAARRDPWPESLVLDTTGGSSDQVWEVFATEASPTWWRPVTGR